MIVINYHDKRPIYEQIVERVKNLIFTGVLEDGEQLPSVRSLAIELSINPNTIQRAYTELERDGYICSVKGRGNFVRVDECSWDKRRADLLEGLKKQLKECKNSGVCKEDVQNVTNSVYGEVAE